MELSRNKSSLIASLSSKKMRTKYSLFVAEGEKCVAEMISVFDVEFVVATHEWIEKQVDAFQLRDVPLYETSMSTMQRISSLSNPSQVMAVFRYPDWQEHGIDDNELYLLLDGVQDPGNLGTIIRTADWFGVDTIYASPTTADVFNPKVVQSTMGSLSRVRLFYRDLGNLIKENPAMPVYGTLLDGQDIYKTDTENRGFLLMGNEGNGITASLREMITQPLLIPPYRKAPHAESLNVAVATAITLSVLRFGR